MTDETIDPNATAPVDQAATTEVTNVPIATVDTQGTDDATQAAANGAESSPPAISDPAGQAETQEPAKTPDPVEAAVETATTAEVIYKEPAPAAPYHLIDTEHHTINLIASHLDKIKEEAIAEIEKISTEFRHPDVHHYKVAILNWLHSL